MYDPHELSLTNKVFASRQDYFHIAKVLLLLLSSLLCLLLLSLNRPKAIWGAACCPRIRAGKDRRDLSLTVCCNRMYVYIYTCIHVYMYIYIYIYIYVERERYTHTYIYIYIYAHINHFSYSESGKDLGIVENLLHASGKDLRCVENLWIRECPYHFTTHL